MQVQTLSIVFMAVSALLSIGVPIGLFIFFRRKYKAKFVPVLVGVAAFVLFALILEQTLHAFVLRPDASGKIALLKQPFLYMLYGCLAAGIFEETARFLSFKLLKKKYNDFSTALSYGVGHGGAEAILLVGLTMINNIILSVMINFDLLATITSGLQGTALKQFQAQMNALISTAPHMFLVAGGERLAALCMQISLSVIVFYSVTCKGKWWLFPLAILLHAVTNVTATLGQVGVIKNIWFIEGYVVVCSVLVALLTASLHKRFKPESAVNPSAS